MTAAPPPMLQPPAAVTLMLKRTWPERSGENESEKRCPVVASMVTSLPGKVRVTIGKPDASFTFTTTLVTPVSVVPMGLFNRTTRYESCEHDRTPTVRAIVVATRPRMRAKRDRGERIVVVIFSGLERRHVAQLGLRRTRAGGGRDDDHGGDGEGADRRPEPPLFVERAAGGGRRLRLDGWIALDGP